MIWGWIELQLLEICSDPSLILRGVIKAYRGIFNPNRFKKCSTWKGVKGWYFFLGVPLFILVFSWGFFCSYPLALDSFGDLLWTSVRRYQHTTAPLRLLISESSILQGCYIAEKLFLLFYSSFSGLSSPNSWVLLLSGMWFLLSSLFDFSLLG